MDDMPIALLAGLAAGALGALADRRRSDPDAVGFMPWTPVFFWACLTALLLLALAAKELFGG